MSVIAISQASKTGEGDKKLLLKSGELITALIQEPEATLKKISVVAPIKASDISVDEDGNILIDNEKFTDEYFSNPKTSMAMENGACININCSDGGPGGPGGGGGGSSGGGGGGGIRGGGGGGGW